MNKDYDKWNKRKKEIDDGKINFYHERDIRWCSLGINIGFEQDGTNTEYSRPVLILKGFSRQVCIILPLTSSKKKNKFHFSIGIVEDREAFVILSQIRLIDVKRLGRRLSVLDKEKFEEIRKAVRDLI